MSRILVVDDDREARAIVARALKRPHRHILLADDGEEALEIAACAKLELIITDVVMPRMSGWNLVRRLRSNRATARLPIIFVTGLGTVSDRVRAFRAGADDYMTKPVDLEELELRVENVLHRARVLSQRPVALAGDLSQFGIATTLTVLELERKSGVLSVERADERAEILVREGHVVRARIVGEYVTGVEAIYELLDWTSGTFRFVEGPIEDVDEIRRPTSSILLEAAQRSDESIPVTFDS